MNSAITLFDHETYQLENEKAKARSSPGQNVEDQNGLTIHSKYVANQLFMMLGWLPRFSRDHVAP